MDSQSQTPSRDDLVLDHLELVRDVLRSLSRTLPMHVDRDDLRSAGYAGLVTAAQSFDESRGVKFAAYATRRVRGAMLDELRSQDWATRSVRSAARNRSRTADVLSGQLRREASRDEIAGKLGTTVEAVRRGEVEVYRSTMVSLEALTDGSEDLDDGTPSPLDLLIQRERYAYLGDAVEALPSRMREVVIGLYLDERSPQQLAADLGVSTARVSQMCREAIALLRFGIKACTAENPEKMVEQFSGVAARRRAAYRAAIGSRSDWRSRLSVSRVA